MAAPLKLLAIPNDRTSDYLRCSEAEFLGEFNPLTSGGKRFFDFVSFLNCKDECDGGLHGINSRGVLEDKSKFNELLGKAKQEGFKFPLFTETFLQEKEDILKKTRLTDPSIVRSFNTFFAAELGIIVSEELGIPLVISAHDPSRLTSAVAKADSLVCISENLRRLCINDFGADPEKVVQIPDGVERDLFYPRGESEILRTVGGDYDAQYKILSVGRVVPSKNLETMLSAIKLVKQELGNVKHIHLGKGTVEKNKEMKNLRKVLGLEQTTYFLGGIHKSKLPAFYSWANVYALPTLWEGLGRASIEALACGTPVVTTNYAPMTEVVKDGFNGLVCDPHDPEELASKMIKILTEDVLKERLRTNARPSVVERYDSKRIMYAHAENYKNVIEKNH